MGSLLTAEALVGAQKGCCSVTNIWLRKNKDFGWMTVSEGLTK